MVAANLGNPLRELDALLTKYGTTTSLRWACYRTAFHTMRARLYGVSCDAFMSRRLRYGSRVSSRYRWSGYLGD